VIGGYLGAGKTTLINKLLASDHGVRLAVLVNDFGAINIDASLLHSANEDTIALTNGCVCCTMSGDLFFTIGDLLDRKPRPDHILIEASGIANPAKIAAVSLAEKELRYAGIVTLVDGVNIKQQLDDQRIAPQVEAQLRCADLLVISKTSQNDTTVDHMLDKRGFRHRTVSDDLATIQAILFDNPTLCAPHPGASDHPAYVQWTLPSPEALVRGQIVQRINTAPASLLRLKAIIPDATGAYLEVHIVGRQSQITVRKSADSTGLVAIALCSDAAADDLQKWWLQ
jgi:G3E family GTPase